MDAFVSLALLTVSNTQNADRGDNIIPRQALYPAEIFPYHIRAKGLAFIGVVVQASSCINTFGLPVALEKLSWKGEYQVIFRVALRLTIPQSMRFSWLGTSLRYSASTSSSSRPRVSLWRRLSEYLSKTSPSSTVTSFTGRPLRRGRL